MTGSLIRGRAFAVAAVAVLGLGAGATGFTVQRTTSRIGSGETIYAEFADVSPIIPGDDVMASGVKVGRVGAITVDHGAARVALELDPSALPVHRDATAKVQPKSLLGERFINLDPGSPAAPALPAGGTIPLRQTSSATDLDQVLDALDDPTGTALAALVTTLGEGVQGQGQNTAAALKALAPALTQADALVKILDQQNAVLNQLVDRVEPVASSLAADNGRQLNSLLDSAQMLLAATAASRQAIDASLQELPGTLASARRTLAQLAGVADAAVPTLAAMRPTTDNLNQISAELQQFSAAADPALASLDPVLKRARQLIEAAQPVAAQLRAAGPDLQDTAHSARPVVDSLSDHFSDVLDFIRNVALVCSGQDGLSHYLRADIVVSPDTATGLLPAAPRSAPPQTAPSLLPSLPPLPVLGSPQADNVTGLTPHQESSMLQFLLGGR